MFDTWNQAFSILASLGVLQNINPAWCWEQCAGQLKWPYYIFPIIRRPGFMMITPSFSPFSVVFSNHSLTNCSSTVDVQFPKLPSDCFVETGSSRYILSSAVTSDEIVLWFLDTITFNVSYPFHLVLVFGHYSSQLTTSSHHLSSPS